MRISFGATLIKYMLFFFNLLWLGLGGVVIWIGFRITSFSGTIAELVNVNIKAGAIVVLAAGFVIFLIALLGCLGVIFESAFMLSTFGLIILILIIVHSVGVYLAFRYRTDVKEHLEDEIHNRFDSFKDQAQVDELKLVHKIQSEFECCGADSYEDYGTSGLLPASCCGDSFADDLKATCNATHIKYKKGCVDEVDNQVDKFLGGLGWTNIGLISIQLLIIMLAYCLVRDVR